MAYTHFDGLNEADTIRREGGKEGGKEGGREDVLDKILAGTPQTYY